MKAGWRVRRFSDGSAVVAVRVRRAFIPLDEDGEVRLIATAARCGTSVWASTVLLGSPHPSPLWLAGGSVAWCVAAWRAESDAEAAAEEAAPAAPEHTASEIYEGIVDYLRHLINDRNGVHLNEALNGLQEQGYIGVVVSVAEFGRELQRRGVPVRASLKVAGQVGPGVHRDDLPALSQPLPEAAHAAAG